MEEHKKKILNEIGAIKDKTAKFKYIIDYARNIEGLSEDKKVHKWKIRGCTSDLWLYPEYKDGKVYYSVDGTGMIPLGISAIIADIYSGMTPDQVLSTDPKFLVTYGITQHLTASRRNGLSGLYKQMKLYAVAYKSL